MRKDTFNVTAHPCFASVIALIPSAELYVMGTFLHQTAADTLLAQPRFVGLGVISLVPINFFRICGGDPLQVMCLLSTGGANQCRSNQLMLPIAANVGFVAIKAPAGIAGMSTPGDSISTVTTPLG